MRTSPTNSNSAASHRSRGRILTVAVAVAAAAATTAQVALAAPAAPARHHAPTAAVARFAVTAGSDVVKAARTAAFAHARETGVSKQDTLVVKAALADPEGKRHVRFERSYKGVPVIGGDLVIHLDAKQKYLGVTRAIHHQLAVPSVAPKLTHDQAAANAAKATKGKAGKAQLVVDATSGKAVLAYQVTVTGTRAAEKGTTRTVMVDATTGKVLSSTPDNDAFISPALKDKLRAQGRTATPGIGGAKSPAKAGTSASGSFPAQASGSGSAIFDGKVSLTTTQTSSRSFTLKDPSRGNSETRNAGSQELSSFSSGKAFTNSTNSWGNGTNSDPSSAAVDAEFGITSTYDFYKKTFGRNGINNDGVGPHAMVHFGSGVANAFWSPNCHCMLYGDGDGQTFKQPLVALDVTGHELTHGVVEQTANFQPTRVDSNGNQFGEAGSLNESYADVFGSAVEFATNNPNNPPNYLIGEKLGLDQGFLRRLDQPSQDQLEGTVDYWDSGSYDREVHAGSGVSSHAFYLVAEGSGAKTINGVDYNSPTYDGSTVTGIGRDKAIQIWYRALTNYLVSSSDFHDARTATLQAAADIYGQNSTEYQTVNQAWAAVNVTPDNAPSAQR
ncbi:M4 family metallopeptidase [Streptomyces orinoci]|uniref:Neutral metalloproteinase n=1 Tax=Streptomyces orinoci TaxID=67339 RepID=A0ABV3JR39_STRON|nr:M4 family metallopeptidase [Streptomyces orinoci]